MDPYSVTNLQVSTELMVAVGAIEQATAVQLVLQIFPGITAQMTPSGVQQLLLQSTNNGTGSTTLIHYTIKINPPRPHSTLSVSVFRTLRFRAINNELALFIPQHC